MPNWGKLWTIRYKKTKYSHMLLLKSWEQKQGIALAPSRQQHQSGVQTA